MQNFFQTVVAGQAEFFITFLANLITIIVFTGLLFYKRHRRRDLFVTFTFFNIAMFIIVRLITSAELSIGVGFGLFALLAIFRLRSEEFSNYEIGYFFGALAIAIVNGLGSANYATMAIMDIILLASIAILDHPMMLEDTQHSRVTLDDIYDNDDSIRRALQKALHADILKFSVLEVDYVRDMTHLNVEYRKRIEPAGDRKVVER